MQVVILSAKCSVYPRKSYDLISLADTKTGCCSFSNDRAVITQIKLTVIRIHLYLKK